MILTKEQYDNRIVLATSLTAMGLKRGRSYTHKDVSVYPTIIMYNTEYIVNPSNGLSKTFQSPYAAANYFVELVADEWRG